LAGRFDLYLRVAYDVWWCVDCGLWLWGLMSDRRCRWVMVVVVVVVVETMGKGGFLLRVILPL
jgi:hypothetical protein